MEDVCGGRGASGGGVGEDTSGEAHLGRGPALVEDRLPGGQARRDLPVHAPQHLPAAAGGLLHRALLEDGPAQGRLPHRRDLRRAPGCPQHSKQR